MSKSVQKRLLAQTADPATYQEWLAEHQRPGGGYDQLVKALLDAQERRAKEGAVSGSQAEPNNTDEV